MKNIAQQEIHGTCGIVNLANALRNDVFIKYCQDDNYWPCGTPEVNKILKEEEIDNIYCAPIITNFNWKIEIPKDYLKKTITSMVDNNPTIEGMNICNIFIMNVQMGSKYNTMHAVTLIQKNGLYYYSDPLMENINKLQSIDDLFSMFIYVNSIEAFTNDEGYIIWDADKLGYSELK